MTARANVEVHIAALREILGCTNSPEGVAWNRLSTGFRASLLKLAALPQGLKGKRWEGLTPEQHFRVIQAATESATKLRKFIEAVEQVANRPEGTVLQ